ncbi:MAG: PaaI family thioesterase [Planctomycetes bacterium]|nr:PaaI family thioesterase [Planctomycetota bacterium]
MFDTNLGIRLLDRVKSIPIVDTLKIRIDDFSEGFCKATVPHQRCYDGIFKSFHGGLLMTVADSIACFAIMTRTGPDEPLTTTDMNIRFLAPCLTDVTAVARVIKIGRTLCPVAVDLFDANGAQVAVAQVTYMRLDKPPDRS